MCADAVVVIRYQRNDVSVVPGVCPRNDIAETERTIELEEVTLCLAGRLFHNTRWFLLLTYQRQLQEQMSEQANHQLYYRPIRTSHQYHA